MSDYDIRMDPIAGTLERIDLGPLAQAADHPWFNQTLIQVGAVLVRLGVFEPGSFHWHSHEEQDEFFLVLTGHLRIELDDREPAELSAGQAFSVPAALRHRPVATEPTTVVMIEPAGVRPTGD